MARNQPLVSSAIQKLTSEELAAFETYVLALSPPPPKNQKRKFSHADDDKLRELVATFGDANWSVVSHEMGYFTKKQCRERWTHYLNPHINTSPWTPEDDDKLRALVQVIGTKWTLLSTHFLNRTDTNVKNRWIVLMRKNALTKPSAKQDPPVIPPPIVPGSIMPCNPVLYDEIGMPETENEVWF